MFEINDVRKARQTDLASFLVFKGEPLVKSGRRFKHANHDSLVISNNMFFWNSRNVKGNSLDFVMLFFDWDFQKAILELNQFNGLTFEVSESLLHRTAEFKVKSNIDIKHSKNVKRVIAYLCKSRSINYDVVSFLIKNHFLFQDEKGNAVFKIYDENKEFIGAEVIGTLSHVRFKQFVEGDKISYGFNVQLGEPVATLFFESAVDLMSYWTIHFEKIKNCRLISLAGLRVDIFKNMLKVFNITESSVILCIDNDYAASVFLKSVFEMYPNMKIDIPTNKKYKDWNEVLNLKNQIDKDKR